MYIRRVRILSIKNFEDFTWELPKNMDSPGWHVLLGDNGSGKSTLLKAVALLMIGPKDAPRTNADFTTWVRQGKNQGRIAVKIQRDEMVDPWRSNAVSPRDGFVVACNVNKMGEISGDDNSTVTTHEIEFEGHGVVSFGSDELWKSESGWFSAAFGPFRRFTGSNEFHKNKIRAYPKVARHISVFNEAAALTETLEWLKDLRFQQLESADNASSRLLDNVIAFVNQDDFLPNGAKISSVSSKGVIFKDGGGAEVLIEDTSDGHRSILSMMLELIRQMVDVYKKPDIFSEDMTTIIYPGVVLIDEVDAHLHPRWQRRIGKWLCKHFPKVQFIVTTHSALVCQGAVKGSVYRLPRPGSNDEGGMIKGEQLNRLLYGNILEAFGSGVFGEGIERSEEGEKLLEKKAELTVKSRRGKLDEQERQELARLQSIFPTEEG